MATENPPAIRTWSDGFTVRRMTRSDAKLVQQWFCEICPTSCDLEVALSSYPDDERGFLVGELNGRLVASAIRIPVSDDVFYGSYYYVEAASRRRGFGSRIRDEVAAEYVGGRMLCIDAHDDLEAMNHRHGYTTAFKVVLYSGHPNLAIESNCDAQLVKVTDVDFEQLFEYDNRCFVRPNSRYRKALLRNWICIKDSLTIVALNAARQIVGYGCRRAAFQAGNHLIGPLYADSRDVACHVVKELSRDVPDENILMSICEENCAAVRLVSDLMLSPDLHMLRMHLNGDPHDYNDRVFALTSIDVCGF